MKTCSRLDYPEEEIVYVLVAEYPGLNKRITVKGGKWETKPENKPKNYKYEAYHVPDLQAYLTLLRHLEYDATRCIINGKPKKTWKPGETKFRRNENITDKNTQFLMFDIDGTVLDGWSNKTSLADSYNMVQKELADVNPAFARLSLEVVISATASWGKPKNTGPRMRVIYKLNETTNTRAILIFIKEFQKRYPYLHLDQAIYRPAQIVYTAAPVIIPNAAKPSLPGRGRSMKNKKSGTINWEHMSHGYDAGYEDIVNTVGQHATPEQDRQFVMLCDKLAEEGLIREYDAVTEKAHIFCPWQEEHSIDTSVSATSMWRNSTTGHATIKCQHASHEDKKTKDFINAWIEQGIVSPQDFQEATYQEAVNDFKEDEDAIIEKTNIINLMPINRDDVDILTMKELKTRFIHNKMNDNYIDRLTGLPIRPTVLDKSAPRVKNRNIDPTSKAPYNKADLTGVEAWHYTDKTVGEKPGMNIDDITWIPRTDMRDCIVKEKHLLYYNSFNGLPLRPVEGDAELFMKHMHILFPDDTGFEWAMGFFAHILQRPWEKPSVALLHISPRKGLGRGLLFEMFNNMLGHMAIKVDLDKLVDPKDFNSFYDKKLLLGIDEVKVSPRSRDKANEKLKSLVTESKITVNKKYADEREGVPVFNRLFMMSNNLDAIKVDTDDRRMFVYAPPEDIDMPPPEHYKEFAKAIENPRFLAAVMDKLIHWRIAVFKPFERPPTTVAKRMMTKATANAIEAMAMDAMEKYGPKRFGMSKKRFKDIIKINIHKHGLSHLLQDKTTSLEFDHVFATWEPRIHRKKYLKEYPKTLFCRDKTAKREHSATVKLDIGRKQMQKWDKEVENLLLEYVV